MNNFKLFAAIVAAAAASLLAFAACSSDSSVSLCNCKPDQYCEDDTCYDTDGSIAPKDDTNVNETPSNE